ncbi:hypothetical protein AN634_15170 (plasmid) [Lactiplantibacillus plantarum]|uniref:hypothetical protein n=1 Tax=Lactiplantibacillus plantarum TaxID=1590 RepID=UPI0006D4A1C4|nr:hypothetical protein [Lactiplantibacillus plantarum]ALG27328.1 hypothetical protein AN634_15170 [Lactiplantibacillus plantarum]
MYDPNHDPMISSVFITRNKERDPILVYQVDNNGLYINVHVQCANLKFGKHTFTLSVKDKNGKEYLKDKILKLKSQMMARRKAPIRQLQKQFCTLK